MDSIIEFIAPSYMPLEGRILGFVMYGWIAFVVSFFVYNYKKFIKQMDNNYFKITSDRIFKTQKGLI